ncbi:MAG: methionyl-tRNA formyltransferase [Armatimonadetes bacterium]|nr:methionyl-tRNA formyltransferase [Armatimonadota bacterium]
MRVLFMGTASFGVCTFLSLLDSKHELLGVVTQPDRPKGRGRSLQESAIKQFAVRYGVPVYQPESVRVDEVLDLVRAIAPDIFVVVAFGQIIPKSLLDMPRYGSVNVHASLLPKYRGAAPIQYALFNGEARTGVTTMLMDSGLDTGPILLQEEMEIEPNEDTGSLEDRLSVIGAPLLLRTLDGLEDGTITPTPQDDAQSSYAPSIKRQDCVVDWRRPAPEIVNLVRGCIPRPGAVTVCAGTPAKLWSCSARDGDGRPGDVLSVESDGITVSAGAGAVLVRELQPENRKVMRAADFARGYAVSVGSRFGPDGD